MARCPFAIQRPLGKQTQPRMDAHDILCYHTMGGGTLATTDAQFRAQGYGGLESHFGIGSAGELYQWQDTDYTADANYFGNWHVISVESADIGGSFKKWTGSNVPPWNPAQLSTAIKLGHWVCDTHKIPVSLVPDSKAYRRGIAGHRQGVDSYPAGQKGYRVPGGELWSTVRGKVCPGDARFAQITSAIIPGIKAYGALPPTPPQEEEMIEGIVKYAEDAAHFYYDFMDVIWIQDPDHLSRLQGEAKKQGVVLITTEIGSPQSILDGKYGVWKPGQKASPPGWNFSTRVYTKPA